MTEWFGRPRPGHSLKAQIVAEFHRTRPAFFNLSQIAFPVGAITSICHRISGIVLALCTPLLIYFLDSSLRSAESYERMRLLLDTAPAKAAGIVILWAFAHHFLAGMRHLLMDVDIGSRLPQARLSAWFVNIGSVAVALVFGGVLL